MRVAWPIPVVLTASLALAGCASPGAAPPTTVSPSPVPAASPTPVTYNGTGPTPSLPGIDFPIPADARSVVVTFTCEGGGPYEVELGDSMLLGQATLRGSCDGTRDLAWPITDGTSPDLSVFVLDGVEWTAVAQFATSEFETDTALAADCASFSEEYSALWNADQGYTIYAAFDEVEWGMRVDRASSALDALAAGSESPISDALDALATAVRNPARAVGAALPLEDPAITAIYAACDANQTPVVISAEFGG